MAGQGDPRPPVAPPEGGRPHALSARKAALVRVAVGVPMLVVSLFGALVAYRVSGRPLGGGVFWTLLAAILAGFGLYFARPLLTLFPRR